MLLPPASTSTARPAASSRSRSRYPRWVRGPEAAIERASQQAGRMRLFDTRGNPLLLFENDFSLRWALERETDLEFAESPP